MCELGNFLKMCRENLGLTQDQVAEVLHVDRSTYAYYELKRIPSFETLLKLSALFRVPIQEFSRCVNIETGSCEMSDYTKTLNGTNNEPQIPENFYDLPESEKALLLKFRILNEDKKQKIIDEIKDEKSKL